MSQKKYFLLINLILGSLLLFSYYNGVNQNPEIASQLWGGVPAILIPYIISSMFLGAFGYFFFTYYLAFKVEHKSLKVFKKFKFSIFNIIYILIRNYYCALNHIPTPNTIQKYQNIILTKMCALKIFDHTTLCCETWYFRVELILYISLCIWLPIKQV